MAKKRIKKPKRIVPKELDTPKPASEPAAVHVPEYIPDTHYVQEPERKKHWWQFHA